MPDFKLYKYIWMNDSHPGYVVYRDSPDRKATEEDWARIHKTAAFVCGSEASNYCDYRNHMFNKYGTDDVNEIIDYS